MGLNFLLGWDCAFANSVDEDITAGFMRHVLFLCQKAKSQ